MHETVKYQEWGDFHNDKVLKQSLKGWKQLYSLGKPSTWNYILFKTVAQPVPNCHLHSYLLPLLSSPLLSPTITISDFPTSKLIQPTFSRQLWYVRFLRKNGVAHIVNKIVQNAVLVCNLKNDRMSSVHFQGKPFNITVTQVYPPTTNAKEAEIEWFYEDLQDLPELKPKTNVLFIIGD